MIGVIAGFCKSSGIGDKLSPYPAGLAQLVLGCAGGAAGGLGAVVSEAVGYGSGYILTGIISKI